MQTLLIAAGYNCGGTGADGIFGNDTLFALMSFQQDHGLDVDGIYGPKSRAALEGPAPFRVRVSISDLNIRTQPDAKSVSWGPIARGVYTIVEEKDGWGLLKSYEKQRNGWIRLSYTTRL
jgi:hypothetical protein